MGNSPSALPAAARDTTLPSVSDTINTKENTQAKCKPCCACPETRKARDECIFNHGEEACQDLIKSHQDCMRSMGFNI